ncbi:hypothetical protein GAMM_290007 [Gammaproteobacteria bacterium]
MVDPEVTAKVILDSSLTPEITEVKKDYAFWLPHIENYAKAGVTAEQYCRENNLSSAQFSYWKNKHKRQSSDFIGIKISKKNINGCLCTLEFPNGRRLLIHDVGCLRLLPQILGLTR